MFEPFKSARPSPVDCRTRLLLDPYLCVGPGCDVHADTLFAVSQLCASLGITLCVERQAWLEAASDPDVVRRQVDLGRFEPVVKLDPLPLPSERDALHWLKTLSGSGSSVMLREIDPRSAMAPGPLADLVHEECEPYDPYLRGRLEAGRGRALVTFSGDEPLAIGVIETGSSGERVELVALAAREKARGARAFEPILSAALAMARRRSQPLTALLPPHEEMALWLLEDLGFSRADRDPHGRECWSHPADPSVPLLSEGAAAWLLPLDAHAHDDLLPEMSGAAQSQLFAVGADSRPQTLGSPVRKQVILADPVQSPSRGDLVLFFHGRAPRRPASASVTSVARVERLQVCDTLEDVLALNASRPGYTLEHLASQLQAGPVLVLDLALLGRLERFLSLARMKELGATGAAPRGLRQLSPDAWQRLSGCLALA